MVLYDEPLSKILLVKVLVFLHKFGIYDYVIF